MRVIGLFSTPHLLLGGATVVVVVVVVVVGSVVITVLSSQTLHVFLQFFNIHSFHSPSVQSLFQPGQLSSYSDLSLPSSLQASGQALHVFLQFSCIHSSPSHGLQEAAQEAQLLYLSVQLLPSLQYKDKNTRIRGKNFMVLRSNF